ncbi:coatomer subunit beta isoform X2 [Arctopsyche grandis]|uniref:coatomer subunit beta isoform X2 n=1 Tax=Arctopsyche grandis TaxID=121162 RepID=UPI00406D7A41
MSSVEQPCYTIINAPSDSEPFNEMQLKLDLETGDIKVKIDALKKTINMILAGEKLPNLLMIIIRFVLPLQDHTIKKLLLIFWEIVPKTTADGKLLQEMILDLQHPNEFLRGATLRFLCKLKEPELLEPLMPTIRACLEHRHSYVRRNAVLAIFTIYKNFEFLIPDAPELIATFLENEQDMSCKRNAFIMLINANQERALSYLASCLDQVHTFGDILQLVIVELIYKVCHANPQERSRFIRCIYNLVNSSSAAVRYEAAGTLVTLSSAPTAIKAAASCYIELIVKESDNNVKLIVLDRLQALKNIGGSADSGSSRVLQDLVMDVLRVLASPDLEVRKKTLALAMDLVSSRNIEEMVMLLKKEVSKTHNVEHEDTGKYRQLLVRTLHQACIKFPDVAATVIPVLMEFLSDTNELAASDVLIFVREAIYKFEHLKSLILEKLLEWFPMMRSFRVIRSALWLLAEFCEGISGAESVLDVVKQCLGDLPLIGEETKTEGKENPTKDSTTATPRQLVTSDGTYATQSAFSVADGEGGDGSSGPSKLLRQGILQGDMFLGACVASALVKLSLRFPNVPLNNESMLIMAAMLNYGKSGSSTKPITNDDMEHILLCLRVLSERPPPLVKVYTAECRQALCNMLQSNENAIELANKERENVNLGPTGLAGVEQTVTFSLLAGSKETGGHDVFEASLNKAVVGKPGQGEDNDDTSTRLAKVTQLTGFSDPVYSEAIVTVNQYDIVLDVLIVNQTGDTLQNCTLEMATLGDLSLVERPSPVVLAPHDFCSIKAHVKVSSTENGIIFGNIVYDVTGAASDRNVVVLNDIHVDIMDYIEPAMCSDIEFRKMWANFEWENKVSVNTNLTDLHEYLQHLLSSTNMKCLTPDMALSGQCGFMAANMYARSIFGEDALANLSIEKPVNKPDAPVVGHIRIRAKSQGMALSLGDKINMTQKAHHKIACAS